MKPTKRQLELIKFCKDTLSTWESTNDINSPTHYNDIQDFVNADLDDYHDRVKDGIYEGLTDLLDVIKKL